MTDETYIEKSDRAFCDFCSEIDPVVTWCLPEGQRVNIRARSLDGSVSHDQIDGDGQWSACRICNEEIIKFKKATVKVSALRRFVKSMQGRSDVFRGLSKEERAKFGKELERHQRMLMGNLLPRLGDPKPFVSAIRSVSATGSPEEIERVRKMRNEMNAQWEARRGE